MLKLKLQYFGHLMGRADSLEKTLMLGKIEGRRRRGQQRMRWLDALQPLVESGITDSDGPEFEHTLGDWRTEELCMLQSLGLQRVRYDLRD